MDSAVAEHARRGAFTDEVVTVLVVGKTVSAAQLSCVFRRSVEGRVFTDCSLVWQYCGVIRHPLEKATSATDALIRAMYYSTRVTVVTINTGPAVDKITKRARCARLTTYNVCCWR